MATGPQRPKNRDGTLSSLNAAIEAMNLAKEISVITPAKAVFGSVSFLLTMIRDSMLSKLDFVELGLACADVCRVLDGGVKGRQADELSQSVREAIEQLTTTVTAIQEKIVEKCGRKLFSRLAQAKNDKDTVASWKLDLVRILQVFNTELAINNNILLLDLHRNASAGRGASDGQDHPTHAMGPTTLPSHNTPPGELPPPPPRVCFGRDELIERIVGLASNLTPIALIGAGGIGKTSIALTVLHDIRIRQRFGDDRRFIRCDKFPASHTRFLHQLSKVIGAGAGNPEDLASLRPLLSSKEMFIILDNAESILDPRGTDAQGIYAIVEELSQLENICLCITSRITTIPPDCETLSIPTLSMEAARDTFHRIYKSSEESDRTNGILEQLDFHPLSITLLATVAHHNMWGADRLAREWDKRRTGVLQTEHNKSLAATIELSLSSPMFQELGPNARDLLGVTAFFPQGVNEDNIDWLFPTISEGANIFDKFCVLSLAHRADGFITMLAPLRDYFRPKDPMSSPLLCTSKDRYFLRLLVEVEPGSPDFEGARWIASEDVNVEYLLDVFTTIDTTSEVTWIVCMYFMSHLLWHKSRLVMLGPKIEGLPDDHPFKPRCLSGLSRLFGTAGNYTEDKRLLTHTLELYRQRGDQLMVARTSFELSDLNLVLGLQKEGISQAKEALRISKQIDYVVVQAQALTLLACLLYNNAQLAVAEEIVSRAIDLSLSVDDQYSACASRRTLGNLCLAEGAVEKAIGHFEAAFAIASASNWHDEQFFIHHSLALLFSGQGKFDDAHAHVEHAKSHAGNDTYYSGRATELQARVWFEQHRLEEARSGVERAASVYRKFGAKQNEEACIEILRRIAEEMDNSVAASGSPDSNAQGTE